MSNTLTTICKQIHEELGTKLNQIENPQTATSKQRDVENAMSLCDAIKSTLKTMK